MTLRLAAVVALGVLLGALAPTARALDLNPFSEYYKNIPRAAAAGDVTKIRQLLDNGYSPNQTDEDGGTTGLHVAAAAGNLQIIAILYKAGADINQKDTVGSSPLDRAAEHSHSDAVKLLLDMKARTDDQNRNGMTALMFAAKAGDVQSVRTLLDHSANPNIVDYTGRDALGWAQESHRQMVVQLIKDAQRRR